mmetsp:Transcript_14536/g.16906  ORF Transcript_14536/g.16906 Transcript_14536/m.16906 type:complete len:155 (+) Transcript_14536:784-1248(+)
MKSNKILNILIAAIAIIGGILFIRIFMEDAEVIETDANVANSVVSPLIYYSTYLFYAAVIITIGLSLFSLVRNPDNLKKTLGGLAVLAVLLFIAFFLSDSAVVYDANNINILPGGEEGSSVNKWVGTGIWYSTILLIIAGAFFIVDLLKGLVKS